MPTTCSSTAARRVRLAALSAALVLALAVLAGCGGGSLCCTGEGNTDVVIQSKTDVTPAPPATTDTGAPR